MSGVGRGVAAGLWVALMVLAATSTAPSRPDQGEWIVRLLTGQWAGEEPAVVALFNLMGVWPFALAAQTAPWLRSRPVPLWPFAVASMVVGAFVLLPGLVVHGRPSAPAPAALTARPWLAVLLAGTVGLAGWAALAGDPAAALAAFRGDRFVQLMSFDFCALWLASVLIARERGGAWGWALVPIVGALVHVEGAKRRAS